MLRTLDVDLKYFALPCKCCICQLVIVIIYYILIIVTSEKKDSDRSKILM